MKIFKTYVYRKVSLTLVYPAGARDKLVCGHSVGVSGKRPAKRRRCRKCIKRNMNKLVRYGAEIIKGRMRETSFARKLLGKKARP